MNLTIVFVELLVAGLGALLWVVPAGLLLTGVEPAALGRFVDGALTDGRAVAAGVALLALVYPLGVVVDAVSDYMLDAWDRCLRRKVLGEGFEQPSGFLSLCVFGLPAEAAAVFNYARMRMRVARAAALNALLAGLTLPFVLGRMDDMRGGWWAYEIFLVCLLMAAGSLMAWHQSTRSFFKFTKQCREAMAARPGAAPVLETRGET
jgi:hypothetical protein